MDCSDEVLIRTASVAAGDRAVVTDQPYGDTVTFSESSSPVVRLITASLLILIPLLRLLVYPEARINSTVFLNTTTWR
jgi:hypothetical protein